jgi:FlaG/FlaF family flagellin (archaellin)
MPKNTSSKKGGQPDANIIAARIGVIAAVITLVGTVATAIFGYMSVRAPNEGHLPLSV